MRNESKQDQDDIDIYTEHLVVLQVVGVRQGRARERMYRALRSIDREFVDDAIASLQAAGVVVVRGKTVRQSPALERIDRLGMICL